MFLNPIITEKWNGVKKNTAVFNIWTFKTDWHQEGNKNKFFDVQTWGSRHTVRTYVRVSQTQIHSALTWGDFCQPNTNLSLDVFFIFRCNFYGTVVSELMLRTKGTFSCSMFTFSLTLSLTPVHNRTISTAVEQRWESTGFTMSVGRLAEPPKHSFLLPSEVSQSHTFMCNACKHMHQTQWHSRETRGGGEWRRRMGCYQNGSEHTGITGQQQCSKKSISNDDKRSGSHGGVGGGARTPTKATDHRPGLTCEQAN